MEQTGRPDTWPRPAKAGVVVLAGLAAVVTLLPWSGVDTDPPQCFSMFSYSVPCGAGLALIAGALVAGVVGLALWLKSRRR